MISNDLLIYICLYTCSSTLELFVSVNLLIMMKINITNSRTVCIFMDFTIRGLTAQSSILVFHWHLGVDSTTCQRNIHKESVRNFCGTLSLHILREMERETITAEEKWVSGWGRRRVVGDDNSGEDGGGWRKTERERRERRRGRGRERWERWRGRERRERREKRSYKANWNINSGPWLFYNFLSLCQTVERTSEGIYTLVLSVHRFRRQKWVWSTKQNKHLQSCIQL